MDFLLSPGIIGGISGGFAVFLLAIILARKSCPKCNSTLPRFRKPSTFREAMLGGWQCHSCSAKGARNGKLLSD